MPISDQLAYYASREQQQRDWAARTSKTECRDFHMRLADHYSRLKEEARAMQLGRKAQPVG